MFRIVPHAVAVEALDNSREAVLAAVERAYLAHDRGETVNPSSHFLRFPDQSANRIIALPAYLGGEVGIQPNPTSVAMAVSATRSAPTNRRAWSWLARPSTT